MSFHAIRRSGAARRYPTLPRREAERVTSRPPCPTTRRLALSPAYRAEKPAAGPIFTCFQRADARRAKPVQIGEFAHLLRAVNTF